MRIHNCSFGDKFHIISDLSINLKFRFDLVFFLQALLCIISLAQMSQAQKNCSAKFAG